MEVGMKLSAVLVLGLVLTAGPAFAQKVYIDYDEKYTAGDIETFAWADTSETSVAEANPLLHSRIVNGIEYYLTLGGIREDNDNPDVYVTYHGSTEQEVQFDTDHWGYGYPSAWHGGGYYGGYGYGGYGTSTTTVRTYEKGTLVVDVWDAESKKLVWRGTALNIAVTDNPTKMEKKIDKALKKMVGEWRKIKEKNAKNSLG
jgi:hypothetical protein